MVDSKNVTIITEVLKNWSKKSYIIISAHMNLKMI